MFKSSKANKYGSGVAVLQCEVCGHQIIGKPHRVIIERAKMTTCAKCAELGSGYWEPEPKSTGFFPRGGIRGTVRRVSARKEKSASVFEGLAVVEHFGLLVRRARERLDLSHEDLARKIGEKVSVVRKVESEKMVPDEKLVAKLEHMLRIRLLTPVTEPETFVKSSPPGKGVTLGEIAILKDGKKRRQRENEGDHSQSQRAL